jgi:SAM-dependent methyltransferase
MHNQDQSLQHWRGLHKQARFRPQYPNESVVRFLLTSFPAEERARLSALDIGVGGGRHTKLLCELGFQTTGVDLSDEGLRHCRSLLDSLGYRANLRQADMTHLPFESSTFDCAVSYGVYYYTDRCGMETAVAELYRVLRPSARAFVVLRTTDDYRCGKGAELELNTFRIEVSETNECGSIQHFIGEADVIDLFGSFSEVFFEREDSTFAARQFTNSDWLITLTK